MRDARAAAPPARPRRRRPRPARGSRDSRTRASAYGSGAAGTMSVRAAMRDACARRRPRVAALDDQRGRVLRLHGDPGRDRERQLQHQRSRVVGDAAHDVEAAGRAREQHGPARRRRSRRARITRAHGARGWPSSCRRWRRVALAGHRARRGATPGSACSSAAVASGDVSDRKLPPPISGPARYLSRSAGAAADETR